MTKKDNVKTFINKYTVDRLERNTQQKIYNHIDQTWSFDLVDMSEKKQEL